MMPGAEDGAEPGDGQRVGRFLVVRDVEGNRHALAEGAISAMCETDDGVLLMLPGGRLMHVPMALRAILGRLDCR